MEMFTFTLAYPPDEGATSVEATYFTFFADGFDLHVFRDAVDALIAAARKRFPEELSAEVMVVDVDLITEGCLLHDKHRLPRAAYDDHKARVPKGWGSVGG